MRVRSFRYSHEEIERHINEYHEQATELALEDGVVQAEPKLRIEQVRDMYLEYRKAKIGIGGGLGVNDKTYINECRNLKGALSVVNLASPIDSLNDEEIEDVVDRILRRVGSAKEGAIMERTANNYLRELRRMLDWAHCNKKVPYRHADQAPVQLRKRFRNIGAIKIAAYDPDQLKKLLATATDRQRLYIYLALNCGYYAVDIGNLRCDQITTHEGRPAIVRRRSKTSHQNHFEAMHTLWPETHELLMKQIAAPYESGLALLSERGTPLYRAAPRCDVISDTYLVLQKRSGVKLSFKQFRKIGATALQRIGGDEARRLYKAGVIDSGDKV